MLRRDFFKAFSAAAAAFYTAKSSVAAVPPPAKKLPAARPAPPARASTGTPEVDRILALLDQCSVVNIERSMTIDGFGYFTVTYIYEEGRKRAPGLAEMFDQSQCRIRSVMVQSSAAVDILDLNSGLRYPTMDSARHEIVIEWVGPASACVIG